MNAKYLFSSILLCLSIFIFLSWNFPVDNNWQEKVDTSLLEKAAANQTVNFLVVLHQQANVSTAKGIRKKEDKGQYVFTKLREIAKETQGNLVNILEAESAYYRSFYLINAIHVKGDIDLIKRLALQNEVASIQDNPSVKLEEPVEKIENTSTMRDADPEWGIVNIGADQLWNMDIRGQGVVVGGQDTGYEWDHPAIKAMYRGWDGENVDHDYNWHDAIHEINPMHMDSIPVPERNPCGLNSLVPCDDHSHGTHTVGTMVGGNEENVIGVAPAAKWIGCRNMERGYGTPISYIECFEWFLAPYDVAGNNPDPLKAPHVINNSWSCPEIEGCNPSNFASMQTAVDNLKAAGVMVVVSAGNSGSDCETINTPSAIFDNSFTIGASMANDTITNFSSRGPVSVDGSGRMKPNVAAPGHLVRSSTRNREYATWSGTSMAGPHVAGAVALIISANPELAGRVEEIETILEQTAVRRTSDQDCNNIDGEAIPNAVYGYGRIDVLAAVEMAQSFELAPIVNTVKTYPNPFANMLNFELLDFYGETEMEIYDVSGKLIRTFSWDIPSYGVKKFEVDMTPLAQGIYFYYIKNGGETQVGKILKQ